MGPRNTYKDMLANVVNLITCVHESPKSTRTNGKWGIFATCVQPWTRGRSSRQPAHSMADSCGGSDRSPDVAPSAGDGYYELLPPLTATPRPPLRKARSIASRLILLAGGFIQLLSYAIRGGHLPQCNVDTKSRCYLHYVEEDLLGSHGVV
jgi:hypothetical protein